MPYRNEKVEFECNYHLLKRWLLKMCFNSARIHNSPDLPALEVLLPYILGQRDDLSRSVQLFLQLSFPQEVTPEEVDLESALAQPILFYPNMNRVGFGYYVAHGIGKKLMRTVHLRSYTFFLAFWQPGRGQAEQYDFANILTHHLNGTVLLRLGRPRVFLECTGIGAWDSFKYSRDNQLEFDADI
jgi:hypothetical protein